MIFALETPTGFLRWGFLSQIKFFFRDVQNSIEKFLNVRNRTEKKPCNQTRFKLFLRL